MYLHDYTLATAAIPPSHACFYSASKPQLLLILSQLPDLITKVSLQNASFLGFVSAINTWDKIFSQSLGN